MAVLRKEEEEKNVPRVEREADRVLIKGVFKGGEGCGFNSLSFIIITFFGYSYK